MRGGGTRGGALGDRPPRSARGALGATRGRARRRRCARRCRARPCASDGARSTSRGARRPRRGPRRGRGADVRARAISRSCAAARCIALAQACEPGKKLPITRLVAYELGDTLVLDDATQRHLELVRTMDGETQGLAPRADRRDEDVAGRAPPAAAPPRAAHERRGDPAAARRASSCSSRSRASAPRSGRASRSVADLERLAVKLAVDRVGRASSRALRSVARGASRASTTRSRRAPIRTRARGARDRPKETPFVDRCDDLHALLDARARRRSARPRERRRRLPRRLRRRARRGAHAHARRPAPHRRARGAPPRGGADPVR